MSTMDAVEEAGVSVVSCNYSCILALIKAMELRIWHRCCDM